MRKGAAQKIAGFLHRLRAMALNQHETRRQLIDRQLGRVGWRMDDCTQVAAKPRLPTRCEIPLPEYGSVGASGITDDCLYDEDDCVFSVVECKRTSRNPREGEEQNRLYIATIPKQQPFAPFGFMANGLTTWFWEVGLAHPRMVAGFFTRADLKRLRFIRENRQPLAVEAINRAIVDRPYQHEATHRVAEAFTGGKRRALLLNATGTATARA